TEWRRPREGVRLSVEETFDDRPDAFVDAVDDGVARGPGKGGLVDLDEGHALLLEIGADGVLIGEELRALELLRDARGFQHMALVFFRKLAPDLLGDGQVDP